MTNEFNMRASRTSAYRRQSVLSAKTKSTKSRVRILVKVVCIWKGRVRLARVPDQPDAPRDGPGRRFARTQA